MTVTCGRRGVASDATEEVDVVGWDVANGGVPCDWKKRKQQLINLLLLAQGLV